MSPKPLALAFLLLIASSLQAQDESFEKARSRWEVSLRERSLLPEDGRYQIVEVQDHPDVRPFHLLEVRPEVPGYPGQVTSAAASAEEVLSGDDGIGRVLQAAGFPGARDRLSTDDLIVVDQTLHSMRWPVYREAEGDVPGPVLSFHDDGSAEFVYWLSVFPSGQNFRRVLRIAADGSTVTASEPK